MGYQSDSKKRSFRKPRVRNQWKLNPSLQLQEEKFDIFLDKFPLLLGNVKTIKKTWITIDD